MTTTTTKPKITSKLERTEFFSPIKFSREWNKLYPWDLWWRKKYNIPFGSPQHKVMSFLDMIIEYHEDYYLRKDQEDRQEEIENAENKLIGLNVGDTKELK